MSIGLGAKASRTLLAPRLGQAGAGAMLVACRLVYPRLAHTMRASNDAQCGATLLMADTFSDHTTAL